MEYNWKLAAGDLVLHLYKYRPSFHVVLTSENQVELEWLYFMFSQLPVWHRFQSERYLLSVCFVYVFGSSRIEPLISQRAPADKQVSTRRNRCS